MELIDKEVLLLKIDSKIEEAQKVFNVAPSSVIGGMIEGYTKTKKIIDTLEVKEVNSTDAFIEKACDAYCKVCGHYANKTPTHICRQACDYYKDFKNILKESKVWQE